MKLVRYHAGDQVKPGILDASGAIRDLSSVVPDIDGDTISPEGLAEIGLIDPASLPRVVGSPVMAAPVANPSKVVCIGLNYSDHAAEVGATPPSEPIIFMKSPTAYNAPNGPVVKPPHSTKLDWEVELCVYIGSRASYVSEDEALACVAGYAVGNDVSEREFQTERPGGQWTKGKSPDGFAPIGPWLVTKDEVPNPEKLSIWLKVNGETMQNGNTDKLIFGVKKIVSFVSEYMTLLPGDVIMTGTPPGVGAGKTPPKFLNAGDVVELGIEGLGEQRQEIVAWSKA
ncbi:MAG: fumarylacetoacetate hydrolase family protein [Alphaproteobacteria bacterium]|nr:fumarylacetoacetate hydrolase family protein [Alphaproteobacteria bacterium]MCB9931248.1 fumarylacetoacetate hydrolase family protein [Alphaproteobacteria bacterium]